MRRPSVTITGADSATAEAIRALAESRGLRVVLSRFAGRKRLAETHPGIDQRAKELRKRGLSYRAIARELGVGVSSAHRLASKR